MDNNDCPITLFALLAWLRPDSSRSSGRSCFRDNLHDDR
jgi:hypothetical protein